MRTNKHVFASLMGCTCVINVILFIVGILNNLNAYFGGLKVHARDFICRFFFFKKQISFSSELLRNNSLFEGRLQRSFFSSYN